MKDKIRSDKKNMLVIAIGVVIVIAVIVSFVIAFNKSSSTVSSASSSNESASEISSSYDNIDYGNYSKEYSPQTKGNINDYSIDEDKMFHKIIKQVKILSF